MKKSSRSHPRKGSRYAHTPSQRRGSTAVDHIAAAGSFIPPTKSNKVQEPLSDPLDHLLKSLQESFTKLKQGNELISNFLIVGENSIDLLRLQLGRDAASPHAVYTYIS